MDLSDVPVQPIATTPGRVRGFFSGAREIDDAAVEVRGALPSWLRGTLLLNGPALWELPQGRLQHWFDGYSMWHALRIDDSGVRYRSRFADSESYRRSRAAGRPVYGEFGTSNPASLWTRLLAVQVTDNPAVVMSRHGRRWLSVTETPVLTYFDPLTLATQERLALGAQGEKLHLMAAHGFTLGDGSYLNVGVALGPKCEIKLLRLAPGQQRPQVLARIQTAKAGYTHGFALAAGHALVWEAALRVQALGMRFNARSYADNFRWEPDAGSRIHAIALDGGAVRSWAVPPLMAFHATQAWADGAGFVLDMAVYDDGTVFDDLMLARRRSDAAPRTVPRHVRYHLRDGRSDAEPQPLGHGIELQQVHPAAIGTRRASVCFGVGAEAGAPLFDRLVRYDLDRERVSSWQRDSAVHLEPLFVPRPGGHVDDDGVLLVPTLAAGDATSVIAVLDARTLQPRAELHAPQIVPFGFHAAFAAG